jgi:hypothetical protein
MTTTTNTTDDDAGRAAGEAFARPRADVTDRLTLCEARDADPTTGSLPERLLAAYAADYALSPDEAAELLFGDPAARPSDLYATAFVAAALPILDSTFGSSADDEEDDELAYGMFSRAGDRAVAALVEAALQVEPDERTAFLQGGVNEIALGHPEVFDTAVRENIAAIMGDPALAYGALAQREGP